MDRRTITTTDRQLAKHLIASLDEIRSITSSWNRLIPSAVIGASYRGDGFSPRGDGGRGSGISDPTAGQMSSVADAIEIAAQLFGGALGYPGEFPLLMDTIRTVDRNMRRLASLAPHDAIESSKAQTCTAGLSHDGYEDWARRDANGSPIRCEDIVHSMGLCASCYRKSRGWQRQRQVGR